MSGNCIELQHSTEFVIVGTQARTAASTTCSAAAPTTSLPASLSAPSRPELWEAWFAAKPGPIADLQNGASGGSQKSKAGHPPKNSGKSVRRARDGRNSRSLKPARSPKPQQGAPLQGRSVHSIHGRRGSAHLAPRTRGRGSQTRHRLILDADRGATAPRSVANSSATARLPPAQSIARERCRGGSGGLRQFTTSNVLAQPM